MTKLHNQPHTEAAAALQRDGFTVVRNCIDADPLRELVDEYEAKFLPLKYSCEVRREVHGMLGEDGLARVVHVNNVCESPGLAELAADRRLLELASACLGGASVRPVINVELFDKPPNGNMSTQTPPHQDNFYFAAKEPGVALWITLDEMDDDSGTVRFVRGSHLRGLRFHEWDSSPAGGFAKSIYDFTDEDEHHLRTVGALSPGDIVVHHGLTIHYAPVNMTSRRRRGLVINYVAEHAAFTLTDDLYVPALTFSLCEGGHFVASVPPSWRERQALASVAVRCALSGWRGVAGGIKSTVHVDESSGKMTVQICDQRLRRQAAIALVRSGHVVRGEGLVRSMPLQIANFDVPLAPKLL
jgi:ectoine hydroxylase-related dioxygenase (phytanoyl-CoA dioxygenase family)